MQVVLDNLRASGLSEDALKEQVTLVKGFFSNTLPKCGIPSIVMLHIDADLYDAYKVVLECLYPKVAIGGVIALDEYDDRSWPGATKAVDEFLNHKEGEFVMHKDSVTGKYYIVKLRQSS
jgi:O-methyltransferase